ncbi:DNA-binding protein [Dissulfurispira thermophila]|uniref:DNA-binding protein n=1 Tax=Dissulfurispira thermophila TaxID=2715679 RepID=UPI00193DE662|nr:DNA-binding protein [Dissulfurispira thermophila]
MGNTGILTWHKTAFLCSRNIHGDAILRCHDWAVRMRDEGRCVISGFHSLIEKDVLRYLLRGHQPLIIILARGMKKRIEPELKKPLDVGRLLILSPFDREVKRVTAETAMIRNKVMIDIADHIVVGHLNPDGNISNLFKSVNKEIEFLR